MSLAKDFLTMTSDTITIASPSTMSKYGAPTYGSDSTAIPARVELAHRVVVDQDGVEQIATGTLYVLSTTASLNTDSKVTLPDGRTPKILRVDVLNDEEGQHHLEVMFR